MVLELVHIDCTHSKVLQNAAKYRSILILFRIAKRAFRVLDSENVQQVPSGQTRY